MFGNKKSNIPPRPHLPNSEHMLEDLDNATLDDVAFKIINKGEMSSEDSINAINTDIYQKVKVYLNTKQQLKSLETVLRQKEEQLQADNNEIRQLADDIRKQAQAALITFAS